MGDDGMRNNCKRIEGAMETEASGSSISSSSKRIKTIGSQELQELLKLPSKDIVLETPRVSSSSPEKMVSLTTSSNSGLGAIAGHLCSSVHSDESSASSNESCEIVGDSLRFVDLEAKKLETETSTCIQRKKFSRETTPSSELCVDSEEINSPAEKPQSSAAEKRDPIMAHLAAKVPSQEEIDEFFTVAEKYEQEQFAKKYNFDIVKDVPLEGRYQWVRLKP